MSDKPTTPKRVQWTSEEDLQCAILASLGFSTKHIMNVTGLTQCQVTYRLNKAHIKRADYRNGTSDMAKRVIERVTPGTPSGIRSALGLEVVR